MAASTIYVTVLFYAFNLFLFWMKYEELIIEFLALCMIFTGTIIFFIILLYIPAPYGRYSSAKWGWLLPVRYSWIVQECPSCLIPALLLGHALYSTQGNVLQLPNVIGVSMVIVHYFQRSLIYPLLIRGGKPTPLIPFLLAFIFCTVNGYMQGQKLILYNQFPDNYLLTPQAITGLFVFVTGMLINLHADNILRNLREGSETGYKIPRGGAFELVSGANLLGEMIEWSGYALYCWNLPAFAFAFFTYANLIPRAVQHHRFYLKRFDDYPRNRRAIFPYIW